MDGLVGLLQFLQGTEAQRNQVRTFKLESNIYRFTNSGGWDAIASSCVGSRQVAWAIIDSQCSGSWAIRDAVTGSRLREGTIHAGIPVFVPFLLPHHDRGIEFKNQDATGGFTTVTIFTYVQEGATDDSHTDST